MKITHEETPVAPTIELKDLPLGRWAGVVRFPGVFIMKASAYSALIVNTMAGCGLSVISGEVPIGRYDYPLQLLSEGFKITIEG